MLPKLKNRGKKKACQKQKTAKRFRHRHPPQFDKKPEQSKIQRSKMQIHKRKYADSGRRLQTKQVQVQTILFERITTDANFADKRLLKLRIRFRYPSQYEKIEGRIESREGCRKNRVTEMCFQLNL